MELNESLNNNTSSKLPTKNFYKRLSYNKQQQIWGIIFVIPWIIGFAIFFAWPMLQTIWYSLNEVKPTTFGLNMKFLGIKNYFDAFTTLVVDYKNFLRVLIEATQNLLINLPVILIFSLFIAVMLNTQFKGRAIVRAIFFIPVIFNSSAINIALSGQFSSYLQVNGSGDANSIFQAMHFQNFLLEMGIGRELINFLITAVNRIFTIVNVSGVPILIFLAAIQSIPRHLYEAAQIEGATKYETFWKITFPLVSPMFLTALVYTVVDSFASSPVISFIDKTRENLAYGLSSSVAIIYFFVNILVLAFVYLIVYFLGRIGVFYNEKK